MRTEDFYDGQASATEPNIFHSEFGKFAEFADSAAYVTEKGSAAANSDVFYNTTSHDISVYLDSAWRNVTINDRTQTLTNKRLDSPKINEDVILSATATELNQLDGILVGGTNPGDIVDLNSVQIMTNKRLNSPKLNEDVILSATATELNQLDGVSVGGNSAGDILTTNATQTITNKTLNDCTLGGTTTIINSTDLEVSDQNILINDGGNDASAIGAGITIDRTSTNGSFVFDSTLSSYWKCGLVGSEVEVMTISAAQTVTNKYLNGGTATDTNRWKLPEETTTNLNGLTDLKGLIAYNTTTDKVNYNDGTGWNEIGGSGSGGGLDVFFQDDLESTSVSDLFQGNNATFLGGGSLDGTLEDITSGQISGTKSIKYTMGSSSTNDYWASLTQTIEEKQQQKNVGFTFYYTYDGNAGDIKFVIYDVGGAAILTRSTDTLDPTTGATRYAVDVWIPDGVTQFRWGFHVVTGNAGKILVFDDLEGSTNPFVYKELIDQQHYYITQAGNALTNAAAEVEFNLATASIINTGSSLLVAEDDSGNTRTKFISQRDNVSVAISWSALMNSANKQPRIYINGTERYIGTQSGGVDYQHVSGNWTLNYGDYISVGTNDSVNSSASLAYLSIVAIAEKECIVTPAKSTLSDWASYTPTFNGFGTPTNVDFRWRRVGDSMEIQGKFTAGTSSTVEAQVGLPNSESVLSGLPVCIVGVGTGLHATASQIRMLATGGDAYLNFGVQSSGAAGLTPQNDNVVYASGQTCSFFARVPIEGWDSNVTFLAAVPTQQTVVIKHQVAANTAGGTFTSGSYQTSTLNTITGDTAIASLSSNQITVPAGKYRARISLNGFKVSAYHSRLYDITGSSELVLGSSEVNVSSDNSSNRSEGEDVFTLTSTSILELQGYCQTTRATDGFGAAANLGSRDEVYGYVVLTKLR